MEKNQPATREQAIATLYAAAAKHLKGAREVVALHEWCVKKFGNAPPLDDETRRIAAMRDVDELLRDRVAGLRGSLGARTH
jgi:hypothetical protein